MSALTSLNHRVKRCGGFYTIHFFIFRWVFSFLGLLYYFYDWPEIIFPTVCTTKNIFAFPKHRISELGINKAIISYEIASLCQSQIIFLFYNVVDINEELQKFSLLSRKKERPIATQVMSFMIRGIFKHINFPIAYFPSNGFDSYQLYPCVWEAVRIVESVGFKVRGLVSDGATPNRKFYRMHLHFDKDNQKDSVTHWTWNRYAPNRKLYFFSDSLHLLKTLRNNWENSHGHLNTRNLVVNNYILVSR